MKKQMGIIALTTCWGMLMQLSAAQMTHAESTDLPYNSSVRNGEIERKAEEVELLIKLNRQEEAVKIIDLLIQSDDGRNSRIIETALYLYQSLGRYESANKMADELYRLKPQNISLLKTQGEILFQLQDYQKAERKLKQYHEKVQDDYRSYHLLGDVYAAMGESIESRRSYERALSLLQKTKS